MGKIKASVVFYEGGCWINARRDFGGLDASEIAKRYGGGGHRVSAGAPIGPDKLENIKLEFERAGLKPMVVDLRKQF
jgi:nanoRNase/pAp phosphatase (c-di-AMP/oligoRNAs hydrolase)